MLTIIVPSEISRSKCQVTAQAFLYLWRTTLLEPIFSDFHDTEHSSQLAVMAASGREKNSAVIVRAG